MDFSNAVAGAAQSIVRVNRASGIVWSNELIVTASHAVRFDDEIEIAFDDATTSSATLVGRDESAEIAVLRTDRANLQPIAWREDDVRVGELVAALGRPGQSVRAALGMISARGGEWRTPHGGVIDRYIETDGDLPRGFSGGPLIDANGRAIGMNTSRLLRGGATIPVQSLRRIVAAIPRPRLGVGVLAVPEGLLVIAVTRENGLIVGDVVKSVNSADVRGQSELREALKSGELTIGITRGGEPREIRVTL
jgi:S1-C subfamily serine protease